MSKCSTKLKTLEGDQGGLGPNKIQVKIQLFARMEIVLLHSCLKKKKSCVKSELNLVQMLSLFNSGHGGPYHLQEKKIGC